MSDSDYSTELVEVSTDDAIAAAIAGLQNKKDGDIVHSFTGDDEDTMDAILDAIANSIPAKKNLDKPIQIENYVVQRVELVNETTGALTSQPRITLIDVEGNAYNVTSPVVFRDLRTILALRGEPSEWKKPLTVRFEEGGSGNRVFVTMRVVSARAPKFAADKK